MFTGDRVKAIVQEYGIKVMHSSPYYAEANSQVEATNKVLIDMIKRTIEDQPKKWHEHCLRHFGHIGTQRTKPQV